jgi:pyruvate,water dikinase
VARQERDAETARQAFEAQLTSWQWLTLRPRVRWALRRLKQWFLWRERNRSESIRVGADIRQWHLVLAQRFVDHSWIDSRDDYFFLHVDEIETVVKHPERGGELLAIAAERRTTYTTWQPLQMPLFMRESALPMLIRQANATLPNTDVKQLYGLGVSAGQTEGEVVVIRSPEDFSRMKPGAILVAPATDPAWTPLFTLAAGVVVEIGGMGSHASTVAREYGLPALANVKNATRLLQDGMRVRLDASRGVLDILPS